jgi:hypothetical protein
MGLGAKLRQDVKALSLRAVQSLSKSLQVEEAISPALFGLTSGDAEDARFRRITSPATLRDLNPVMHERMQQVSFFLKATNLYAQRFVGLIRSYVMGEGFAIVCKDQAVQEVVDRFWNDDVNQMDQTLVGWCEDLSTFGELCLPVAVNPVDGFVRVGYIDPVNVESVEYGSMTTVEGTQTVAQPIAVRLKKLIGQNANERLTIVRRTEDVNSDAFGRRDGQSFWFAINKAKAASRGISDLFAAADWFDVFDQTMFDFADRVRFLNAFVWHWTLNGADEEKVKAFQKDLTKNPPRQGGVRVTNEQVKCEAVTPSFAGADMTNVAETLKKYVVGGVGFSPMFFGDPVDSNRSTANEMEGPTGKKLTDRQNELKTLVRNVIEFVIDQAEAHGVLTGSFDRGFEIQVPDLLIKDIQKASTTLTGVTNSMAVAEDRGWVRGETAARAIHVVLSQLGVTVDSKEEYEAAQKELADKRAQDVNALNDQENLANALKQQNTAAGNGMVN